MTPFYTLFGTSGQRDINIEFWMKRSVHLSTFRSPMSLTWSSLLTLDYDEFTESRRWKSICLEGWKIGFICLWLDRIAISASSLSKFSEQEVHPPGAITHTHTYHNGLTLSFNYLFLKINVWCLLGYDGCFNHSILNFNN